MKFVMTQAVCAEGLAMLSGKADVFVANRQDPNQFLDDMRDADALIVRIGKCDRKAIENSPKLKVIGRTGVGYDSVDIACAAERGIPVVVTPGANSRSVAEHTLCMMLALSKNLVEAHMETIGGNFEIRGAGKMFELTGKKAGIIGLGRVGKNTAQVCQGIGMRTAAYDPYLTREEIEARNCERFERLHDMLKECDVICVHCPLNHETRNMIAKPQLAIMKKNALLINTARGGIVNEADWVDALNAGTIAGGGTDVFEEEPPKPGHHFFSAKNMVSSPHSAAQSREAVVNMATQCVQGCLAVLNGEKWPHVADESAYNHSRWR
jgi:D-3-phosphoglycerate dehydrogenase / 2-oxoglutarate reductase